MKISPKCQTWVKTNNTRKTRSKDMYYITNKKGNGIFSQLIQG